MALSPSSGPLSPEVVKEDGITRALGAATPRHIGGDEELITPKSDEIEGGRFESAAESRAGLVRVGGPLAGAAGRPAPMICCGGSETSDALDHLLIPQISTLWDKQAGELIAEMSAPFAPPPAEPAEELSPSTTFDVVGRPPPSDGESTMNRPRRPPIVFKPTLIQNVKIRNTDRSVGAVLSHCLVKYRERFPKTKLVHNTIRVQFEGHAGQSFGAFLLKGVSFELEGDANDGFGKGLSGGRLIVRPPRGASQLIPHQNIIVGNAVLYGATAGQAFISGIAAERFAVRNSGAVAVVEGCGDHGCEYMTRGLVAVLGML